MSIPLNNIVNIKPGVLDVGNNGNNLFGLMLTKKVVLPAGQTSTFTSVNQVAELFGYDSREYDLASVYFAGFTNSDRVAAQLYIAPYYTEMPPCALFGGYLGNVDLDAVRNLSGDFVLEIETNSSVTDTYTASDVDLSGATSFSDAARRLNKEIVDEKGNIAPVSITYSSATKSMIITAKNNVITKITASEDVATGLKLTSKTGAELSHVAVNTDVTELLNQLRQTNLSFCSVFLAWDLSDNKELQNLTAEQLNSKEVQAIIKRDREEKLAFAKWANSMKDDVCVILNDANIDGKATDSSTITNSSVQEESLSFAEVVTNKNYEGVVCTYKNPELCAFIAGYPAAWDLTKTDGRFTAAFRRNSLLEANVQSENEALTLKEKGYNFYGAWASSTSNFTFMYEGRISGQYVWLDSWFCQVWIRRQFQYYFVMTLLARGQIPYNTDGKGILTTAIKPAIDQYLNFGAIRPGISLADEQVQQLKQAGLNQSQINNITTVGYYLSVDMGRVTAQTRVKRGSPPISFWYTDGQSVQQINMNSIEIQ